MTTSASNPYNEAQAAKAVNALKAFLATKKADTSSTKQSLFNAADESDVEDGVVGVADPDLALWLVVTTKKFLVHEKKAKQERITLPNPYLTTPSQTFTVCVITKDPATYYRSLIPHLPYHSTSITIISPSKLKTHYKTFEARRQLERSHDIFLADDRVIPLLPNLLGKSIYRRSSKVPVPIKLSKIHTPAKDTDESKIPRSKLQADAEKLQKEIERAVKATYFVPSAAASQTIKIGIRSQDSAELAANVTAILEHLTKNMITSGWEGVRAIHLKAADTVALPVWLTDSLFSKDDVMTEEEAKKLEYMKTDEGKQERKKEIKGKKEERKKGREERKSKKRNWDSDVESGEDQYYVRKIRTKQPEKRKAVTDGEESGSAKKTKVDAAADDDSDEEEGGVKLPQPVDLSEQAKKLKIGDKKIAPPALGLKEDKKKAAGKEKLKRKASKSNVVTRSKKTKSYQ